MRIELILQYFILVADVFRLQLFVLNQYQLLAADKVDDAATAGDEASHDEVPQRMEVMVYHRVDGRNIKCPVQEDKDLPQQIAEYPRQDERKQNLCSRYFNGRLVEMEQACIDGKEDE